MLSQDFDDVAFFVYRFSVLIGFAGLKLNRSRCRPSRSGATPFERCAQCCAWEASGEKAYLSSEALSVR